VPQQRNRLATYRCVDECHTILAEGRIFDYVVAFTPAQQAFFSLGSIGAWQKPRGIRAQIHVDAFRQNIGRECSTMAVWLTGTTTLPL
jgi:hypothetical protein